MVRPATCRICSQEYVAVANIYIPNVDGANNNQCLSQLIFWCASVQAEQNEGSSKMICTVCKQELLRTYRFLSLLKQSSVFLKQEIKALEFEEEDDVRSSSDYENFSPVKMERPDCYMPDVIGDVCRKENGMENWDFFKVGGEAESFTSTIVKTETAQNEKYKNVEEKNETLINEEYVKIQRTPAANSMQILQPEALHCDLKLTNPSTEQDYITCKICYTKVLKHFMKKHMKIHSNKKMFKCDTCSKQFSLHTHLKVHMMIHIGEKAFQCGICAKEFSQVSDLNIHKLTHTLKCKLCSKEFAHVSGLKRHMMIHDSRLAHKKTH